MMERENSVPSLPPETASLTEALNCIMGKRKKKKKNRFGSISIIFSDMPPRSMEMG
jgi:ASC-1-like (ASCH) protein